MAWLQPLCLGSMIFLLGYVLLLPRYYGPTEPMPVNYLPLDGPGFPATTFSLLFFSSLRFFVATQYKPSSAAATGGASSDEHNGHFVACHATSLVHAAVLGVPAICISVYLHLLPFTNCPPEVLYLQSDAIRASYRAVQRFFAA